MFDSSTPCNKLIIISLKDCSHSVKFDLSFVCIEESFDLSYVAKSTLKFLVSKLSLMICPNDGSSSANNIEIGLLILVLLF